MTPSPWPFTFEPLFNAASQTGSAPRDSVSTDAADRLPGSMAGEEPDGWRPALRAAYAAFHAGRRAALARPEAELEPELLEYTRLLHGGPTGGRNLAARWQLLAACLRAADPILERGLPPVDLPTR